MKPSRGHSWFFTITLISDPLRTASNASRLCVRGNVFVINCLRSTTPRESKSIAEGKHDDVYRVIPEKSQAVSHEPAQDCQIHSPRTSSSLFVTASVGKMWVCTWPRPTPRSTIPCQRYSVMQGKLFTYTALFGKSHSEQSTILRSARFNHPVHSFIIAQPSLGKSLCCLDLCPLPFDIPERLMIFFLHHPSLPISNSSARRLRPKLPGQSVPIHLRLQLARLGGERCIKKHMIDDGSASDGGYILARKFDS